MTLDLFPQAPVFPPALPADELKLLARLPQWSTVTEIGEDEHAPCRRLERMGLVRVQRQKMDPCAIRPTWFAGKLAAATLRVK